MQILFLKGNTMEINELKADRIKNQEGYRFTSLMELKEKVKKIVENYY